MVLSWGIDGSRVWILGFRSNSGILLQLIIRSTYRLFISNIIKYIIIYIIYIYKKNATCTCSV